MWPKLSQIEGKIWNKITRRNNAEASGIVAWIRVISGAETTKGKGLILQSNQMGWTVFTANGGSYYGSSIASGDIGVDLDKNLVSTGSGRVLRPSPIVTGLQVKEGKDQISREGTLNLKCFSLEQMELMQSYFMEPGYSLCIEYGWSTSESESVTIDVGAGADSVIQKASNRNLSYDNLHAARVNSNGDYDSFLGFIVGGSVASEGETFNLTITLRGMPGLPSFMQSQHKILELGGPTGKVKNADGEPLTYGTDTLETPATADQVDVLRDRRFKNMFNALPTTRQTKKVQALLGTTQFSDFINFDAVVNKTVSSFTEPGFWSSLGDTLTGNDPSKVEVNGAAIEKDKLFSKQRYIRFSLAKDILLANNAYKNIIVGGKRLSIEFSFDNVRIGAFPYIFSTKKEKLIIPGFIPDFSVYFLNTETINQLDDGNLESGGVTYSDKDFRIFTANGDAIQFTEPNALDADGLKEDARCWGYLKNLYINFDMFHSKITQSNKNIREILEDILNEMSAAVNGFWNFQIAETQEDDRIILTIIDENWIGKPPEVPLTFAHAGSKSVFLESDLDISIPGEMLNQLVNKRLSFSVNPDEAPLSVGVNTFFSSIKDLFIRGTDSTSPPVEAEEPKKTETEDKTAKLNEAQAEYQTRLKEYNDNLAAVAKIKETNPNYVSPNTKGYLDNLQSSREEYQKLGGNLDPKQVKATVDKQTLAKLSQNLSKIDVVPRVNIPTMPNVDVTQLKDHTAFLEQYRIFCFDDVAYLDKLKNDSHSTKNGNGTLSHPLPIKYRFKILGSSGLRRGDMFNIDGIPEKYRTKGLFQITEVSQNIENMTWTTEVLGEYRQLN